MGGDGGFNYRRKDLVKTVIKPKGINFESRIKSFTCPITGRNIFDGLISVPCNCVFDSSIEHLLTDICPVCGNKIVAFNELK